MPQNRPRVYIIAFNRRYFGSHLEKIPNALPKARKGNPLYADLRDVLEKGEVPPRYFLSAGYLETLERHKVRQNSRGYGFGMKVVNDPSIEHPVSSALLATGGSGRERNLVYDPANGEKYAGIEVKGKYSPINSKYIRTMTPSEWGKLQGFINYAFLNEDGSEGFSFPDSVADVQKYKQFGNSVTIPVIESMAQFICDCLEQMTAEFSPVEQRLYTMYGKHFLMCNELYRVMRDTLRDNTFLQWVDAYFNFGLDIPFRTKDLANFLGYSYARGSQILNDLVDVGFAEKLDRGIYKFTSKFIQEIVCDSKTSVGED